MQVNNFGQGSSGVTYTVGEFAKLIGVSVKTLQRWDRDGVLIAHRTLTNRRYYTDADYQKCRGDENV